MKISKKLIIVIIVVAVAGYFVWKKMKENGGGLSVGDSSLTSEPDHTSLDYILTHINFTSAERNKIEAVRQAVEASNNWKQSVQAKANQNGLSFDQQLVCEAIWLLYTSDGHWTNDRGWKLVNEVKNL